MLTAGQLRKEPCPFASAVRHSARDDVRSAELVGVAQPAAVGAVSSQGAADRAPVLVEGEGLAPGVILPLHRIGEHLGHRSACT
jgi:hypothetical protein